MTYGTVGIGTAAPATKLHVETTEPGTAVYGNALGTSGIGVVGSAGAGNIGVYARNTAGGTAVHAEGNATQVPDKGGFVKAMIFVNGTAQLSLIQLTRPATKHPRNVRILNRNTHSSYRLGDNNRDRRRYLITFLFA